MTVKLGLPKGSLEHATMDLFRRAGFLIPRLKEAGGEGIVEFPLNKIVM